MIRLRIVLAAWLLLAGTAFAAPNAFTIPSANASPESSLTIAAPAYTDALFLLANASQTQTVPTGAAFVVFSGTCNFYAKTGASVAVPGATTTDGTAPQLNPAAWWLSTGPTQISVISAVACTVTLSFYK